MRPPSHCLCARSAAPQAAIPRRPRLRHLAHPFGCSHAHTPVAGVWSADIGSRLPLTAAPRCPAGAAQPPCPARFRPSRQPRRARRCTPCTPPHAPRAPASPRHTGRLPGCRERQWAAVRGCACPSSKRASPFTTSARALPPPAARRSPLHARHARSHSASPGDARSPAACTGTRAGSAEQWTGPRAAAAASAHARIAARVGRALRVRQCVLGPPCGR